MCISLHGNVREMLSKQNASHKKKPERQQSTNFEVNTKATDVQKKREKKWFRKVTAAHECMGVLLWEN